MSNYKKRKHSTDNTGGASMADENSEKTVIEFEEDAALLMLDLFNKEISDDGQVVDKTLKTKEVDEFSGDVVTKENFAGVLPGSKLLITKSNASLAQYIAAYCKKKSTK